MLNWFADKYGNLNFVVLKEYENVLDGFEIKQDVRYRVLDIKDGFYRVRLFDKENMLQEIYPTVNGKYINYIPFIIHGGIDVQPLFLTEILDLNVHHYRISGDLAHALHWVALPTPVLTGIAPEEAPTTIGPTEYIVLENPDSKAHFLEFTGKGLNELTKELGHIESTISNLTVNIIRNGDKILTATQAKIDSSSTTSSLVGTLRKLSEELSIMLSIVADWKEATFNNFLINTDFINTRLASDELTALVNAYITGAISFDTFWTNLQDGEIASISKTPEQELTDIETTLPPGMNNAESDRASSVD
jgi:hypothetical protein